MQNIKWGRKWVVGLLVYSRNTELPDWEKARNVWFMEKDYERVPKDILACFLLTSSRLLIESLLSWICFPIISYKLFMVVYSIDFLLPVHSTNLISLEFYIFIVFLAGMDPF